MQSLKNSEQLVRVLHVEAGPVIADEINILAVIGLTSDLDDRGFPFARVLESVRKQVHPDLFQQRRVAMTSRQFANAHVDLALAPFRI
jgi:hypothetical protein